MMPSSHSQPGHHHIHGLKRVARAPLSAQVLVSSPPRWKSVTLDDLLLRVFTKEPMVLTAPLFLVGLALVTLRNTKEINSFTTHMTIHMNPETQGWAESWQDQRQVLELFLKTPCLPRNQPSYIIPMDWHRPEEGCGRREGKRDGGGGREGIEYEWPKLSFSLASSLAAYSHLTGTNTCQQFLP